MEASSRQRPDDGPVTYISSSPELSSPPRSESESAPSPSHNAGSPGFRQDEARYRVDGGGRAGYPDVVNSSSSTTIPTKPATATKPGPRKRDNTNTDSVSSNLNGRSATRKSRSTSSNATSRKKQKIVEDSADVSRVQQPARQAKITELVGSVGQPLSAAGYPSSTPDRWPSKFGNPEAIRRPDPPNQAGAQPPPPRTSGQNYDPIRSANNEAATMHAPYSSSQYSPPRSSNRASASPSIASLIDPPSTNISSRPASSRVSTDQVQQAPLLSPSLNHIVNHTPTESQVIGTSADSEQMPAPATVQPSNTKKTSGTSTGPSSQAPSPKPAKPAKAAPTLPPLPQGNGMLSSALFGGPTSAPGSGSEAKQTPTIILEVPMKGMMNQTVNFARMAEERYGFDALYPRIAAQRDRLARVAAVGAALERDSAGGSGDDMSVDSEPESAPEVAPQGVLENGKKPRKKRQAKSEDYDKDDPFVDDSEMLWEEHAAASKDGFFVYSGPLVPAGEKPTIERADGTVKRGRGRGRGGSTRGTGSGRGGGGPGSRGGATVRKPRIRKADRLRMELEKQEREQMALLAAKPVQGTFAM